MSPRFPRLRLAIVLGTALAGIPACQPPPRADRAPLGRAPGELKVVSFNVNYGGVDMARSADALRSARADLVALQETTPAWEAVLRRRLRDLYPHQVYRHAPAAGGMAWLSRFPLAGLQRSDPPAGGWFQALHATARTPLGPVHLLNVHLRPPFGQSGRTSSVASAYFTTRRIREAEIAWHLKGLPGEGPAIVLGDFNEGDGGRAVAHLKARGFRSVLARRDPGTATWQWPTSVGTLRARLDHVLYRGLRLRGAQVLPEAASDHFPVEAIFARR